MYVITQVIEATMAELSQNKGVLYEPLVVDACSQFYVENKLTTFRN